MVGFNTQASQISRFPGTDTEVWGMLGCIPSLWQDCNGTVSFEELEQVLNSASMEGWPSPCRGSNQRMGSFMVDHHFIYQFLSFSPSSTFAQTDAIAILHIMAMEISWNLDFVSVSNRKPQKSVRNIRVSQTRDLNRSQAPLLQSFVVSFGKS